MARHTDPRRNSHVPFGLQGAHQPQPQQPPATADTAPLAKRSATPARPAWRSLVCSLLLSCGLLTLTAAPLAQPAFADQWCTDC